jgi:hypothetical protein
MSALRYSVVVLPKLDSEEEIRRLREEYDPWYNQISPYVTIVAQFTPATLDEIENLNDYISLARRSYHPLAVGFHECVEVDDRLLFVINKGKEELSALQHNLVGARPVPIMSDAAFEPRLVVARVPDPERRGKMKQELSKLIHTIGLVDSLSLIDVAAGNELKLVANYPFGIGRIDFFEKLRA